MPKHTETDDSDKPADDEIPGPEHFVMVEPDIYSAGFIGIEAFTYFGRAPKLKVWFQLLDDTLDDKRIAAYYAVKKAEQDKAGNVSFTAGWKSAIVRDIGQLDPNCSPSNLPTRFPVAAAKQGPIRVRVVTVKKDSYGVERPEQLRYSKISRILGWDSKDEA